MRIVKKLKFLVMNVVLAFLLVCCSEMKKNAGEVKVESVEALRTNIVVKELNEFFVFNKKAYPNCKRVFNEINFEGWIADESTWSVVDGAMQGVGGTSRLAYTEEDYGSFRLIFSGRLVGDKNDHLGVLFWGSRPTDPTSPMIDNGGWIQFMPPFAMMWDYHPPKHSFLESETIAPVFDDWEHKTTWCTTEILCNLDNGTMRAAVDGVEVSKFKWKWPKERIDAEKRIIPGPIGMFRHGKGTSQYKDIYIESNPKEDILITVEKAISW